MTAGAQPQQALAEAEARLEGEAPGYLGQVRAEAQSIGLAPDLPTRARRAVDLVDDASIGINADVSTASSRLAGRVLKRLVSRLVRFYVLHVVGQVAEMGVSASWMGRALYDYVASLESRIGALEAEVAELKGRSRG